MQTVKTLIKGVAVVEQPVVVGLHLTVVITIEDHLEAIKCLAELVEQQIH
jgi:hypothetical protein